MEKNDRFYLEVYGQMLAYEVVEKIVVLPTKTDTLAIREKQDLVTLITCTPYTVNTHRLLVTGKRVPFTEEASSKMEKTKKIPSLSITCALIRCIANTYSFRLLGLSKI